jgi:hypothetical protein
MTVTGVGSAGFFPQNNGVRLSRRSGSFMKQPGASAFIMLV